jgi:hypothetical protein
VTALRRVALHKPIGAPFAMMLGGFPLVVANPEGKDLGAEVCAEQVACGDQAPLLRVDLDIIVPPFEAAI